MSGASTITVNPGDATQDRTFGQEGARIVLTGRVPWLMTISRSDTVAQPTLKTVKQQNWYSAALESTLHAAAAAIKSAMGGESVVPVRRPFSDSIVATLTASEKTGASDTASSSSSTIIADSKDESGPERKWDPSQFTWPHKCRLLLPKHVKLEHLEVCGAETSVWVHSEEPFVPLSSDEPAFSVRDLLYKIVATGPTSQEKSRCKPAQHARSFIQTTEGKNALCACTGISADKFRLEAPDGNIHARVRCPSKESKFLAEKGQVEVSLVGGISGAPEYSQNLSHVGTDVDITLEATEADGEFRGRFLVESSTESPVVEGYNGERTNGSRCIEGCLEDAYRKHFVLAIGSEMAQLRFAKPRADSIMRDASGRPAKQG